MTGKALLTKMPQRILLTRFDTLGDLVLLEGFLDALTSRNPRSRVALLVRRAYADLRSLFPEDLDWIVTDVDPHKTDPDLARGEALLRDLGDQDWDLLLVTAHNRTWADNLIAAKLTRARRIAIGTWKESVSKYHEVCEGLGLSAENPFHEMIPVPEMAHEVGKYAHLWKMLTGEDELPEPRLRVSEYQNAAARQILASMDLKPGKFCLCVPAGTQKVAIKVWPSENYAGIITRIEREYGLPTLIAGHRSESTMIRKVTGLAQANDSHPRVWLGRDGEIPLLAALTAQAGLYLGNDTGPMHMAAAVGIPVVAIFGGGTWPRFVPCGGKSVAIAGDMPCFGCGWDCMFGDAPCMTLVTAGDVIGAVDSVLKSSPEIFAPERILPASKGIDPEFSGYIARAFEIYKSIQKDRRARLDASKRLERLLKESEEDRAARLATILQFEKILEQKDADIGVLSAAAEMLQKKLEESEADRAARLQAIDRLTRRIEEIEADRVARLEAMERLARQLEENEAARSADSRLFQRHLAENEADRAARLLTIDRLSRQLEESEADRAARLLTIGELGRQLAESEADRLQRLAVMEQLAKHLQESEADRGARLQTITQLGNQLKESEADRGARLQTIMQLGNQLEESEADRGARLQEIGRLSRHLEESDADRAARLTAMEQLGMRLQEIDADRAACHQIIEKINLRLSQSNASRLEQMERIRQLEERVRSLEVVRGHFLVRLLVKLRLVREAGALGAFPGGVNPK